MRILTNITTDDLEQSKRFYVGLLGLEIKYDSDWYVQLCVPGNSEIEYGLIKRDHDLVPEGFRNHPSGMYVTFVVDDVDEIYKRAVEMDIDILQQPRNEFYGQRRFLIKDPSGCLIDICSPWENK